MCLWVGDDKQADVPTRARFKVFRNYRVWFLYVWICCNNNKIDRFFASGRQVFVVVQCRSGGVWAVGQSSSVFCTVVYHGSCLVQLAPVVVVVMNNGQTPGGEEVVWRAPWQTPHNQHSNHPHSLYNPTEMRQSLIKISSDAKTTRFETIKN